MATYEVYVGGPGRRDYSRSQYPAPAFAPAGAEFLKMKVAAHKGPSEFALTRTLDFANDHALAEFVRNQAAAGAPLAAADVLGLIVVPKDTIFKGCFVRVETPVAGVTLTLRTRAPNSIVLGTIDGGVIGSSFRDVGGTTITQGPLVTPGSFSNVPRMVEVVLTAIPAGGLGALRVHISPSISHLEEGQY